MSKYWIYYGIDRYDYQEEEEFETEEEAFAYARKRAFEYYEDWAESRGRITREDIWREAFWEIEPFDEVNEEEVDELYFEVVDNSMLYKVVEAIPGRSPHDFEEVE